MSHNTLSFLYISMVEQYDKQSLRLLAATMQVNKVCKACQMLVCDGWESLPISFDAQTFKLIGTLKHDEPEPTWDEYHPQGTDIWSNNAPIAVKYHPYNRCDIHQCKNCTRIYLQYTEYGGYYVDKRIRALNLDLITDDE